MLTITLIASGLQMAAAGACLEIKNDLDRLACYDKEAGRTPKTRRLAGKGKWQVSESISKLTDKTNVTLAVQSDQKVDCGWNENEKITLIVRCRENKTALLVVTGCHMTSSEYTDYGDVAYRIDDNKARTVGMEESTNNRALGLWRGGQSIPVIKQMFGGSKITMRMTPYGENPFTVTFTITGLEEAIKPLRNACSW